MPCHHSLLAFLLLGTLLAAPHSRYAHGHEEPICSSDLSAEGSKRNPSIRIFDSTEYAALVDDWPRSGESLGRIDTHQHYIPHFYADYLDKYSAIPYSS